MNKSGYMLAAAIGCAAGFMGMACLYASTFFRTCKNTHKEGGFTCSECGSHTDYHPINPFTFCPMCGAFVERKKII